MVPDDSRECPLPRGKGRMPNRPVLTLTMKSVKQWHGMRCIVNGRNRCSNRPGDGYRKPEEVIRITALAECQDAQAGSRTIPEALSAVAGNWKSGHRVKHGHQIRVALSATSVCDDKLLSADVVRKTLTQPATPFSRKRRRHTPPYGQTTG